MHREELNLTVKLNKGYQIIRDPIIIGIYKQNHSVFITCCLLHGPEKIAAREEDNLVTTTRD